MKCLRTLSLGVLLLLAGCATRHATGAAAPMFPTRDEWLALARDARVPEVRPPGASSREPWTLAGPFPAAVMMAPHGADSAPARRLLELAKTMRLVPTLAFECVAREEARFIAEVGHEPGSLLRDFIAGRCATGVPLVSSKFMRVDAPAGATSGQMAAAWANRLDSDLVGIPPGAHVGVGVASAGGTFVAVVSWALPRLALEPLDLVPPDGLAVVLRGTAEPGTASLQAAVTRGAHGAADCEDLGLRPLPEFDLRCPLEPGDVSAWLTVLANAEGRLLAYEVSRVLVWPRGEPSGRWEFPNLVPDGLPATPEALVREISAIRAGLGRPALEFSARQSDDNRQVAPFLFDAIARDDATLSDRLALGVVAGWQVQRDIARGHFFAQASERADGSLLLTRMLLSPLTRARLLDARATDLALGFLADGEGVAVLGSTYEGLEQTRWPGTALLVVTRLNAARARLGRPPVRWRALPKETAGDLRGQFQRGELDVPEAMDAFLRHVVELTEEGCSGLAIGAQSVDQLQFPPALLAPGTRDVFLLVAHGRQPRAPWGRVVVLVALPGGAP